MRDAEALLLVDNDQAFQRFQGKLGVRQPAEMLGVFEVELVHLPAGAMISSGERLVAERCDVVTRQRRLAALAGTEDADDSVTSEVLRDPAQEYRSFHLRDP